MKNIKNEGVFNVDMVLYKGNIFTTDQRKQKAEAVAIKDGKITAVGSNEEVLGYKESSTKPCDKI